MQAGENKVFESQPNGMNVVCSMCKQNSETVLWLYNRLKPEIPENRHYIFAKYAENNRKICIECYIKTVLMFQKLAKN